MIYNDIEQFTVCAPAQVHFFAKGVIAFFFFFEDIISERIETLRAENETLSYVAQSSQMIAQRAVKDFIDKNRIMGYTVTVHFSLPRSRSIAARLFFIVGLIRPCKQFQRFRDVQCVIYERLEIILKPA